MTSCKALEDWRTSCRSAIHPHLAEPRAPGPAPRPHGPCPLHLAPGGSGWRRAAARGEEVLAGTPWGSSHDGPSFLPHTQPLLPATVSAQPCCCSEPFALVLWSPTPAGKEGVWRPGQRRLPGHGIHLGLGLGCGYVGPHLWMSYCIVVHIIVLTPHLESYQCPGQGSQGPAFQIIGSSGSKIQLCSF